MQDFIVNHNGLEMGVNNDKILILSELFFYGTSPMSTLPQVLLFMVMERFNTLLILFEAHFVHK